VIALCLSIKKVEKANIVGPHLLACDQPVHVGKARVEAETGIGNGLRLF
jgi:hypothetical protein